MQQSSTLYPLYIIVLNWNLPADTIVCIRSVLASIASLDQAVRVLLVDNGSTDDSVAQFQAAFGAQIQILAIGQNLGFAGGMNAGMRCAMTQGAAAVLLLNNDTVVDVAMIPTLLSTAAQKPNAAILGPAIFYYDEPQRIWQVGDNEQQWLPIPRRVAPAMLAQTKGEPLRIDYVTGCCLLIRCHVLVQTGLFDERYFMYFEEADLCRRVRDAGYEIWSVPAARMWHKVATSAQKDRPGQRYWRTWGKIRFLTQHPHGRLPWLIHIYLLAMALMATGRDVIGGDRALIAPLWAGLIDGYRGIGRRGQHYFRT